jgi:hypothetical protein
MQTSPTREHCFGMLNQRQRWGLSARGWLALLLSASLGVALFAVTIHPFLAVTDRVDGSKVLVVEGWIHEYAIRAAVDEFNSHGYRQVIATGGPVEGLGRYVNDYGTAASIAAGHLRAGGIDPARVAMAPSQVLTRDRTYASAVALRTWLETNSPETHSVNIVTADVHARRTRLLFQLALGDRFKVGVIAVPSPDYDAGHWWRFSQGVRGVFGETLAYLYAKLLFFPAPVPEHPHVS